MVAMRVTTAEWLLPLFGLTVLIVAGVDRLVRVFRKESAAEWG